MSDENDPRHARAELETARERNQELDEIMHEVRGSFAEMRAFRQRNHLADKWYRILHGGTP